jgi:type 1 glutamine amidotransferase
MLTAAVVLATVAACGARTGLAADAGPVKIVLIGKQPDHPHGSHMYLHTCGVLAKCLKSTPGIETVVSDGWPKDPQVLEGVRCLVVYTSPAAELLIDSPHAEALDKAMRAGTGLVTLHWASSVRQANYDRLGPRWTSYLGGTWISNVGLGGGKSPLVRLVPEHPICRGWESFEIEDEYYLKPVVTEKAVPLLQVRDPKSGADVIVGWSFERAGGGRSFGTTLGHPYANFQRDDFRRLVVNAILWSARVEVPQDGAPVRLAAEDLSLPPKP